MAAVLYEEDGSRRRIISQVQPDGDEVPLKQASTTSRSFSERITKLLQMVADHQERASQATEVGPGAAIRPVYH
jgi:hypothetical protein